MILFRCFCLKFYVVLAALLLTGCGLDDRYRINLMPAPDIFEEAGINPFTAAAATETISTAAGYGILYATNRLPATADDPKIHYQNERGEVTRLGRARTCVSGNPDLTWEQLKKISLLKNRATDYPLEVCDFEELGMLGASFTELTSETMYQDRHDADEQFADIINSKLAVSGKKEIYIYVHGYKVVFENPILVASELWHFLGYDGVFIAYSWPSIPKTTAYMADIETASLSATHLRILLNYLAGNTDAEKINLISYSAGSRVVLPALHQIAIRRSDRTREQVQQELRIGNVILVGSDYDRMQFGHELSDGSWKVPEALTIYQSGNDKALGVSQWVFKRNRLGQIVDPANVSQSAKAFILSKDELEFVDVTLAEGNDTGNGHAYFRSSPWASSDILMTLMYGLDPGQRGLVQETPGWPVWTFPPDYIERLKQSIQNLQTAN